jgi:DNA-binding NtrC family response regulator
VDDDADVGEAKASDLRRAGLRVRTALTAEYALDFSRTQPFDAVVIDHHSGDAYSEAVLEQASDVGPAVVVSSAPSNVAAEIGKRFAHRVFAVREEPLAPSDLVETVQEAVATSLLPRSP